MKQYQIEYKNKEQFQEELIQLTNKVDLKTTAVLFQIYSELIDNNVLEDLSKVIELEVPNAEYVVCTVFEKSTTRIKVKQYEYTEDTIEKIVQDLKQETEENKWVRAIEMYVTLSDISTTALCEGLEELRKDIQIFGGIACSEDITDTKSLVYSKGARCSSQAVVFILLGGTDFYVESMYVIGWKPLGKKFYITKAEGSILYELDGSPAYEIYQKYLNINNDENFFYNTLEFPLLYEHNGITILRTPLTSNIDGSLTMTADMETGSLARIAYGNPCEIVETIKIESQKIQQFKPNILHIFSCGARRTFWNSDTEVINELKSFSAISNTVGFFTHGEFLRTNGCLNQHNVTLVIGAMREREVKKEIENKTIVTERGGGTRIPIITRLATFIGVASKELEETNKKLSNLNYELELANHKLGLLATFDGLTNLYNRATIQKRIEKSLLKVEEKPFSLIMLDIDNFKRINDTYGHQVSDTVIIALSNILNNEIDNYVPNTFAGRWGGEEFMVLLPNTSYEQALYVAKKIQEKFSRIVLHINLQPTVSVGVTQTRLGESLDSLCTRVDKALYRAKNTGKNKIIGI